MTTLNTTPQLVALIDQLAAAYTKALVNNPKSVVRHNMEQAVEQCPLIVEAGIIATVTGLSPRQLAEQRAELLEALKFCVTNDGGECLGDNPAHLSAARAAIAKATGGVHG